MFLRAALFAIIVLALLAVVGVTWLPTNLAPTNQRLAAQQRWSARALNAYRAVVQIDRPEDMCVQELEVRGNLIRVTRDTCRPSWLSRMTVARLFELSERLEQAPECFPSMRDCPCRRVRLGAVSYDAEYGYPRHLEWRREIQPYWIHADFWAKAVSEQTLPACGSNTQPIRVTVMALLPLT